MKQKIYLATLAALIASTVGIVAYAANSIENDTFSVESANISMTQAIATAEQHTCGKASRAEYEKHKGQWIFDVEVVKTAKTMDVSIDATSGKVLAAVADRVDHDDENDQED